MKNPIFKKDRKFFHAFVYSVSLPITSHNFTAHPFPKYQATLCDLYIHFCMIFKQAPLSVFINTVFFLMFVIISMRFLCKEKLEKLPGKLENSRKTESPFLWWICIIIIIFLFVIVVKKFSEKKIGTITKESRIIRANCKNYI
jgi:heme/copper-type cytochrome/quinol oxidase subunit 2